METARANIAEGLKRLRKAANMTPEQVGKPLGKSGKTIYAWEVGRGQPNADELILLCQLFGVHLRDFYGEDLAEYADDELGPTSSSERELVFCYRELSDEDKDALLRVARKMVGIDFGTPIEV